MCKVMRFSRVQWVLLFLWWGGSLINVGSSAIDAVDFLVGIPASFLGAYFGMYILVWVYNSIFKR